MAADDRAYVSLVAVATDLDGMPLLLLSGLSDHTKNLGADPLASMLFDGTGAFPNPQEGPRATVMGRVERAEPGDLDRMRRRYLACHPGAGLYAGFADFAFFRLVPERLHWIGGLGRAAWVGRTFAVDAAIATRFAAAEPGLLETLAPRAGRIAQAKLKRRGNGWRFAAIDPDGCVLAKAERTFRLAFPEPLTDPAQVEAVLETAAPA
jgi:putative heme iron utilization protein